MHAYVCANAKRLRCEPKTNFNRLESVIKTNGNYLKRYFRARARGREVIGIPVTFSGRSRPGWLLANANGAAPRNGPGPGEQKDLLSFCSRGRSRDLLGPAGMAVGQLKPLQPNGTRIENQLQTN